MCPTSVLCRLCLCSSSEFKTLVDETGEYNEIFDIVSSYFDAMLLTREICMDCWKKIHVFYEYQQSVFKAQAALNDVVKIESSPTVLEMVQIVKDINEKLDVDITRKEDFKDYNPFGSDDEVLSPEYSNKKIREFEEQEIKERKNSIKKINASYKKSEEANNLGTHDDSTQDEHRFKCSICNKDYKYAVTLRRHIATHTIRDIYQCPYCATKFQGKNNIPQHVRRFHPKEIPNFNNKKLKSLNSTVSKDKIYNKGSTECQIVAEAPVTCFEQLNSTEKNSLSASLKEETIEPDDNDGDATNNKSKYKCSKCDKVFSNTFDLRYHAADKCIYQCPHCSVKYKLLRTLRRHIKLLHPDKYVKHNRKVRFTSFQVKRLYSNKYAKLNNKKLKNLKLDSNKNLSVIKDEISNEENAYVQSVEESSEIIIEQLNDNIDENLFNAASEKETIDADYHVTLKEKPTALDLDDVNTYENKYKCEKCEKSFKNVQALSRHKTTHTVRPIYKCPCCPTKFRAKASIPRHVKRLHPSKFPNFNIRELKSINSTVLNSTEGKRKYKCNKCDREYSSRDNFRAHTASHKNESLVRCPYCRSKFTLPVTLRRHIRTLHPEKYVEANRNVPVDLNSLGRHLTILDPTLTNVKNEGTINEGLPNYNDYDAFIAKWKPELECDICKNTFKSFAKLRQHFKDKHPRDKCHVVCCEQKILFRIRLVDHIRLHLDPHSFKCNICGKCSDNSQLLLAHMRSHPNGNRGKQFQCEVCQIYFQSKIRLLLHSDIHNTEKKHFCKVCNKGFSTAFLLKKHDLKEHVHKHEWPCKICGARFRTRVILRNHKAANHIVNKTPCICTVCGEKFLSKRSLKMHKRNAHGKRRLRTKDTAKYQCPHCPLTLMLKRSVPRHIRTAHPNIKD